MRNKFVLINLLFITFFLFSCTSTNSSDPALSGPTLSSAPVSTPLYGNGEAIQGDGWKNIVVICNNGKSGTESLVMAIQFTETNSKTATFHLGEGETLRVVEPFPVNVEENTYSTGSFILRVAGTQGNLKVLIDNVNRSEGLTCQSP